MTEEEMCKLLDRVWKYAQAKDCKKLENAVRQGGWNNYRQFRNKLADYIVAIDSTLH